MTFPAHQAFVVNVASLIYLILISKMDIYTFPPYTPLLIDFKSRGHINPLNPVLNPICYLQSLLGAHHFLLVSRIRVKFLTFRLLMSYIYIYIYDISRLMVNR